jgi:hypothetical protein
MTRRRDDPAHCSILAGLIRVNATACPVSRLASIAAENVGMPRLGSSRAAAVAHGGPSLCVTVNRAPVLTLWAAVVAGRLGFDRDEALTMGRVVAGLNAYTKGRSLGIFKPVPEEVQREGRRLAPGAVMHLALLHRAVPLVRTRDGLRALAKGKPVSPDSVQRYLERRFGDALGAVEDAMNALARSLPVEELAHRAFELYEMFRPAVPSGVRGWGAAGVLNLARIRAAAR